MNDEGRKELIIDINTADVDELIKIPGIGPELASRIVAARPYQTLDELQRVSGINTVFIERIAPYVKLTSTLPDEADVQQLVSESEVEHESIETPVSIEEDEIPEEAIPLGEENEVLRGEGVVPVEGAPVTEKEAPPATHAPEVNFTRSQVIWIAVGSMIITLILTLLLSLGILAGVNGGRLRYASPAQVSALSVRADGLKSAIDSNAQDLASLRKRVDNLDSLSGRVSTVEQSVEEIGSNMDAVSTQVEELGQKADELTNQIETLQQQNDRFSNFFSGLKELMNNLFGTEEGSK